MTTKTTERDLIEEVEELLAGVPERLYDIPHPSLRIAEHRIASRPDAFWHAPVHVATVRSEDLAALFARSPELLRRLKDEVKELRAENTTLKTCDACERKAVERACRQHGGRP